MPVVAEPLNYFTSTSSLIQTCLKLHWLLSVLILPAFYGFLVVVFSWLLIFFDSTVPGGTVVNS
jgi:hypothetical protein